MRDLSHYGDPPRPDRTKGLRRAMTALRIVVLVVAFIVCAVILSAALGIR